MHPYWIEFGLGAARTKLMNDAIAVMQSLGATVETFEIPSQNVLNNYGTCVTAADVAARRATPVGTVPPCSTVLLFGFKRSEEHTSELQSHRHLVCRLLLEKKKVPVPTLHPQRSAVDAL